MAPVVKALQATDGIDAQVCVTAQHRQMLDQVLDLFDIQPDYDLDIMKSGQDLTDVTTSVLQGLKTVLQQSQPDRILVHGDTTTTFAATLAAYYQRIPVGHIEAGLRTGDNYSPWPEEINRKLTGAIADLHFAPTEKARENLLAENIPVHQIIVTGNTVIDALLDVTKKIANTPEISRQLSTQFSFLDPEKRLILVTGHRRENFGRGFEDICLALKKISVRKDVQIVYPVHLNPNKRVFGLVIDFGTSQSPKSTRPLTTYWCPSRPGHQALRNNFASSLLLRTWLPMTGRRVRRPTLFSLWRKARRENSAASRLLGSTSLRFALHGWQRGKSFSCFSRFRVL